MGDGSRGAVWFGASGFELVSVHDDEDGLFRGRDVCGRGRLLGVWDAWEGEGSAVGDVGGQLLGHLGDGAVAQTDLVVSGDGVCGEDVDRAGVVGGTAAGDHGPGAAVGGRSARRGRGDGGVVGSSVAGDMVNGVGCGVPSARPVSMTVTGSQ